MKKTKIYFDCIRISWDCMACGLYNVGEIDNEHDPTPLLTCHRCKARRIANMSTLKLVKKQPQYPFSTKRRKRMGKISQKYAEKWQKEFAEKKRALEKAQKKTKKGKKHGKQKNFLD